MLRAELPHKVQGSCNEEDSRARLQRISFNDHVSIGAEAAYFYQDVDIGYGADQEDSGTDTKLILRFRF